MKEEEKVLTVFKGEKEDSDDKSDISCSDTSKNIKNANVNEDKTNNKEINWLKGRVKSLEY